MLEISATVDPGTGGNLITNTATVTALDQEDAGVFPNEDTAQLLVRSIDIQIEKTVAQSIDQLTSFSVYGSDGRNLYPTTQGKLRDPLGRKFHVVGTSTPDDFSVAAF